MDVREGVENCSEGASAIFVVNEELNALKVEAHHLLNPLSDRDSRLRWKLDDYCYKIERRSEARRLWDAYFLLIVQNEA